MPKVKALAVEVRPQLGEWWDPAQNPGRSLEQFTPGARAVCGWKCPDGHRFEAPVYKAVRLSIDLLCPTCSKIRSDRFAARVAVLKATPVSAVPALMEAWRDEADPATVPVWGHPLRKFECPRGHRPRMVPSTFLESGCPHCRAAESQPTYLADTQPEMAAQWHPTRNKLGADEVVHWSERAIWWLCATCGHEWEDSPRRRQQGQRWLCPKCETVLDSLGRRNPELASEWSPANELTPWHVHPYSSGTFEWVCSTDSSHVWRAPLASRSNGAGCPECSTAGVSAIELAHHEAAVEVFGAASSGRLLSAPEFTARSSWTADIAVEVNARTVVIEYDGAYWHADKSEVDEKKSRDLLAAGYRVVRLREHPLLGLDIMDEDYLEVEVFPAVPRPRAVMDVVAAWARR